MVTTQKIQEVVSTLLHAPSIQKALEFIDADQDTKVAELKEMVVVYGTPFCEHEARSPMYVEKLTRHGATDVAIDSEGNAFGWVRGGTGPVVAFEAHLDTVFPKTTPLVVTEKDGRLYCPGISDDTAGLATVLSVLRAIRHAGLEPEGSLFIGGTVGEEGTGDLRGIKALLRDHAEIGAVVSLEPGVADSITYQAAGSRRFEFIVTGPGGHSWQAHGLPSPIHALGRAIGKMAQVKTPSSPKTTCTVGTISGGTSVNSIALEARCRLDMRSASPVELAKLEKTMRALVDEGVAEENAFCAESGKTVSVEHVVIGDRPAGMQADDAPIIQIVQAVITALGGTPKLNAPASTNANAPISKGIPAVVLRTGGTREGNHSLDEWFNPDGSQKGAKLALLTLFALAGLKGVTSPCIPAIHG